MNFILQRYSNVAANGGSTQGILIEKISGNPFICHTIEDEKRDVKVAGETRIPAGFYELKIWNDGQNPNQWVLDHRAKYGDWFKFPIEVTKVPGFAGVLIHTGIDQKDTEGCILLDDTIGNNTIDPANQGARSLQAVKRFYEKAYPVLESSGKAFLEVRDEEFLIKAFIPNI
jgi:hypothetical protein